jgi:adenine-specific DNA-methyltransferase
MPLIRGVVDQQREGFTLKDLCIRISAGVATGADEVFISEKEALKPALAEFARPSIAGRELNGPCEISRARYAILLPYTENGGLLDESNLGALGQYLASREIRERLMRRTCVRRKPWYAFHETPPLGEILRPKILCKDIAQKPYFWIDRKGDLVPRHSVYYIVPQDATIIDRLCEHLNSPPIRGWLLQHCQRAANGFLRLQSTVLKKLPGRMSFEQSRGTLTYIPEPNDPNSLGINVEHEYQRTLGHNLQGVYGTVASITNTHIVRLGATVIPRCLFTSRDGAVRVESPN